MESNTARGRLQVLFVIAAGVLLSCSPCLACRYGPYPPIWTKSLKSTTPLFRVVVGGKAGYIDAHGRIVIKPQFDPFYLDPGDGDFINGTARVLTSDGTLLIDQTGAVISDKRTDENPVVLKTSEASEGLTAFAALALTGRLKPGPPLPRTYLRGYLDANGQVAIPARFAYASPFSEGLAAVALDGNCWVSGYRESRFPAPSAKANYTSCGPALADPDVPACRHGFIDRNGSFVIKPVYELAREFSEGRAAVRSTGRWGFIDSLGVPIVQCVYERAGEFRENRAAVRRGGKWGYIDRAGVMVILPQFADALPFSQGFAAVRRVDHYEFIDAQGRQVLPGPYMLATPFVNGLAHVQLRSKKWAWINRTGERVFVYEWVGNR